MNHVENQNTDAGHSFCMTGIVMTTKILIMMLTNDHAFCMTVIMMITKMMLTMLFATVCEVVEAVESKCALVPPTITNLHENNLLIVCPAIS